MNLLSLATKGVQALQPYQPGKPLDELEREYGISQAVKLASNENPLGPSPAALRVIREQLDELSRYPDGNGFALKTALAKKWDQKIDEPARQFFFLPLMHSECITDQERCVRLLMTRMPETGAANMLHAKAHRDVIRKFGRFPFRNEALERKHTEPERDFLDKGGYGATVEAVRQSA